MILFGHFVTSFMATRFTPQDIGKKNAECSHIL